MQRSCVHDGRRVVTTANKLSTQKSLLERHIMCLHVFCATNGLHSKFALLSSSDHQNNCNGNRIYQALALQASDMGTASLTGALDLRNTSHRHCIPRQSRTRF